MEDKQGSESIYSEIKRKMIHILSSVIPLSYYFIDRYVLLLILFVLLIFMVMTDILRHKNRKVNELYNSFLGDILRSHENMRDKVYFTGGTFLILGFLICVFLFEKNIAITSMMIIVFSDTAAAITGKFFGKHSIGKKTAEGSLAFFVTGIIIFVLVNGLSFNAVFLSGIITLLLTTVFELYPFNIDDNLIIPVFFGIMFTIISDTDFLI